MFLSRLCLLICILGLALSVEASETSPRKIIHLAVSTSVENSKLLDYLLPKFTAKHPYEIKLHVVGSGKALRLGRTGDVDMVWVNSPPAEKKFVANGNGVKRHVVMQNNFTLLGPAQDVDNISSSKDIYDALKNIAQQQLTFVSRGDDSGTNKKELAIWKKTGIDPYGEDWYLETGSGMASSLEIAKQNNAYIIIDKATFLVHNNNQLKLILEDAANLANPYSVIAVNPEKHSHANITGATNLINWLVSTEGQNAIADYQHKGTKLYSTTGTN